MYNRNMKETLDKLMTEKAKSAFVEGYTPTKTEVLGLIISDYLQYDGKDILQASAYALEDANFHGQSAEIMEMSEEL